MIPFEDTNDIMFANGVEILTYPSFTHKMLIDEERVKGYIDDIDAYKQFIYKCINTEKGIYPIYPTFGIKKQDLFGKSKQYAFIVLTRRIEDALMLDDRTNSVYAFEYIEEWSKEDKLGMKFKVKSVFNEEPISIEEVLQFG